jgi:uncharacterized MnhB-related membrane protein
MIAAFTASIILRDFIQSVIAFALGSALLAGVFSLLGAYFSAVLELTVGAGLTAVLFIVAITLTEGQEERGDD